MKKRFISGMLCLLVAGGIQAQRITDSSINTDYESRLENPIITVSLYRRNYATEYALNYDLVDLRKYISNSLVEFGKEFEYTAIDGPVSTNKLFYNLKENLVTGTYKIVFKLYDDKTYIGDDYEYIIIK